MKYLSILILLTISTEMVFSQEDSIQKIQHYKEVIVQGKALKDDGDNGFRLQSSTESLLNILPSVTMIKRGNYALEPTIRGLNAGQINMTIDGMQIFGACTDKMDVISSYVEPTNLEKIELNTSPDGSQTGSSVGGGINFKLMRAEIGASRKFNGSLGAGYQTNSNYYQGLGKLQYSAKRWAILVNGIYRKADNYHAADRKEILFSQFEKWNAGINLAVALNENNRLYIDYIQDEGYNIGYPALTMDVGYAKAYVSSITHQYENIGKTLRSIESKLFFNYIDHTMDDSPRPKEMVPIRMDMPGTSMTFGAYSKANVRLGSKHLFSIQLNGYQNDLHAEMTMYPDIGSEMFMLTVPDARRKTIGITLADRWIVSNKMKFDFGGRFELNASDIVTEIGRKTMTSFYQGNPNQTRLNGNVFVNTNYKLRTNLSLFAGANYGNRSASLHELYGFYLFNRVDNHDYLGNPDLKNESSLNGNIGSELKYKKFAVRLEGYIYAFSNYITGLVVPEYSNMAPGASGVKQYSNIPSALLTGAELSIIYNPIEALTLQSINSYTFGIDNEKNYLPYIPPFKSANSIAYDLKGFVFKVEHVGSAAQNNVSTERYGESTTPAFNIFSFNVQKYFHLKNHKRLHAEVGVENIFDTPYYEHLDVMKIQRQGVNVVIRATFIF